MIKVFGHKAPDTDTICAAIAYADYLNNTLGVEAKPYRLGDLNRETAFVLEKFGIEVPELLESVSSEDVVAIVDTNNPDELPEGIADATITDIVDHHKLAGGLSTPGPINMTIKPVACTCTIIYTIAEQQGEAKFSDEIAGIMLASILSDTLLFRSPTTTDVDKEVAEVLAEQLGVDMKEFAYEMFDKKSDLTGMSATEIANIDSKVFELKGKKIRVSVLETTKPENAIEIVNDLRTAMKEVQETDGTDDAILFVVDILNEFANPITISEYGKSLVEKAFSVEDATELTKLEGIVSRKKQIVPALEGVI